MNIFTKISILFQTGFNPQNGNGHVNLTYNKMHDVTYKPLLTNNYWNNNDYQVRFIILFLFQIISFK